MLALLLLTFSSSSSSSSSLAGSRKCKKGYLHCMNGRCVASRYWCDGVDNCGDNSDEVPCNSECLPGTRPAAARALSAAWDRDSGFRRELDRSRAELGLNGEPRSSLWCFVKLAE